MDFYQGPPNPINLNRPSVPYWPRHLRPRNQNRQLENAENSKIFEKHSTRFRMYTCPGCGSEYNFSRNRNVISGRVPRVLHCAHTMCEFCVLKTKKNHSVKCVTCSAESSQLNDKPLDFNYYILGRIAAKPPDTEDTKLVPTGINLLSGMINDDPFKLSVPSVVEGRCEFDSCTKSPSVRCVDCCAAHCGMCSEMIHRSGKGLANHRRGPIESGLVELRPCLKHEKSVEDFYCSDCDESVCCYCFLDSHEGHARIKLTELNDDEQQRMDVAILKTRRVLENLYKSFKKSLVKDDDKTGEVEVSIGRFFSNLHAFVCSVEKDLLDRVETGLNDLTEINQEVARKIDRIKRVLFSVDGSNVNKRALLSELENAAGETCCLISKKDDDSIRLVVDEDIYNLTKYIEIKRSSEGGVRLLSLDDLPEDYEESVDDNIVDLFNDNTSTTSSRSVAEEPIDKDRVSTSSRDSHLRMSEMKTKNDLLTHQIVYVTHINSLDSFYVQLKESNYQFNQLKKSIAKCVKDMKSPVDNVEINELYICPSQFNSSVEWCRGRVLSKIEGVETETYKIFFIDYGKTAIVPHNKIFPIHENLAFKKPFAIHCKLKNPSTDVEWSKDSHLQLAQIIVGHEVMMTRKNLRNDINEIDLSVYTSAGDTTSVTDLLVSGYGALSSRTEKRSSNDWHNGNGLFENSDKFTIGESVDIHLKYVVSPDQIYIQKTSYDSCLKDLIGSLEKHYNNSRCDIHLPIKGTNVVVNHKTQFPDYGNWHRGRVDEVLGNKRMVEVFLVDWGKTISVRWSALRMLKTTFRKVACLVLPVKMADISVVNGSEEAIKFLCRYCSPRRSIVMTVKDVDPLEVALFERHPTYNECINALLVTRGMALSTGKISLMTKWLHNTATTNEKKEEDKVGSSVSFAYENETDDSDEEGDPKCPIEVIRAENPDRIYVKFHKDRDEGERLDEELQIHYNAEEKESKPAWEVDDKCVVFDRSSKRYFRGVVIEIIVENYKVYLPDHGLEMTVASSDLYLLHRYFNSYSDLAVCCRLANLKPAGDSYKWSQTAIEWLRDVLINKNIYIRICTDNKESKSMPVKMWYAIFIEGTALEPSTTKMFCINNRLVNLGLALRIHKTEKKIKRRPDPPEEKVPEESVAREKKEEEVQVFYGTGWKPPLPLARREFMARVLCAESSGYLFVRDDEQAEIYETIEKDMKEEFDSLPEPKLFKYRKDDMVTVRSESYWYRSTVLKVVDDQTLKIMMIDFGSDHLVPVKHVHKRIMFTDIPTLALKIKLHNVYSREANWLTSDVDCLIESVSDHSKIVIKGGLHVDIPEAEVFDTNGVSLNETLVSKCPNLYRYGDRLETSSSSDDVIIVEEYTPIAMPTVDRLQLEIVSVITYQLVSLYVNDDDPLYFKTDFVSMSEQMQKEGERLPIVERLEIGTPCVALFAEDKKWYRAEIYSKDYIVHGYVTVFFVDYGNMENVAVKDVRTIKAEWMKFPVKFFLSEVDVKITNDKYIVEVTSFMETLEGKSMEVEFLSRDPFKMRIFERGELFYKSLIEEGKIITDQ